MPDQAQPPQTPSAAIDAALLRTDVQILSKDVPLATRAVLAGIDASDQAVVPVTSPWTSKINITQAVTAVLMLLVAFGVPISDDQKVSVLTITGILGQFLTGIFKTFFTRSISSASK